MGLKGKRKLVWENGRQYLVSPATLLVSGVLAGSKGPLYYPPEEIAASAAAWEGMPLTLRHPVKNGFGISASTPGLLDVIGLGKVRDIRVLDNKRLRGQTWFDVERVRNTDPHLLERLERGENVELSTGLYTDNIEAPPGSSHNGRPYTHVARNYRPDHLAILPDEVGACSLSDGCGVLTNREAMVFNRVSLLGNVDSLHWETLNCGGPGSGVPGPCPSDKSSFKELADKSGAKGNRASRKAAVQRLRQQLKDDPEALQGLGEDAKKTYSTLEKITGTVFTALLDAQEVVGKMIENEINPGKLPDDVTESVATVASMNIEDISSPSASYLAASVLMNVAPKVLSEIQDSTRWLMDKLSGRQRVANREQSWLEVENHVGSKGQSRRKTCGCSNTRIPCRCQAAAVWHPVGNRAAPAGRRGRGHPVGPGSSGTIVLGDWQPVGAVTRYQPLTNAELSGGRWVTTEDGNRLYIKDDGEIVGNPHVVRAAKGEAKEASKSAAAKFKPGVSGNDLKAPVVSPKEGKAFKHYSSIEGYKVINKGLRDGTELTGKDKKAAELISAVMERQEDFKEPVAVYRAMSWKTAEEFEEFASQLKEGGTLQTKGFLSTTLSERYAEETFGHKKGGAVVMEIAARRGVRMTGKSLTEFEEEREVLMNHNSQFRVASVSREGNKIRVQLEHLK